jgi:hypothetical protein
MVQAWLQNDSYFSRTAFDMNVYIHSPGNEIWLSYAIFPLDVTNIRLIIILLGNFSDELIPKQNLGKMRMFY